MEPKKRLIVIYGNYFWEFYNQQNQKVKERIDWTVRIIQELL